MAACEDDSG